jgi:hypothetical protein
MTAENQSVDQRFKSLSSLFFAPRRLPPEPWKPGPFCKCIMAGMEVNEATDYVNLAREFPGITMREILDCWERGLPFETIRGLCKISSDYPYPSIQLLLNVLQPRREWSPAFKALTELANSRGESNVTPKG